MKGTEDIKGKNILTVKESWVQKHNWDEAPPPIVTSTPRGEPTEKMTINILSRMKRMADIMRSESKRFRTTSDVIRAAMYVGMTVLFHMHENEISYKGKRAYERLEVLTSFLEEVEMAEEAVRCVKLIIDRQAQGWYTRDDAIEKISAYRDGIREPKLRRQFDLEFKDMLLQRNNPADLMFYLGKFRIPLIEDKKEDKDNLIAMQKVMDNNND